MKIFKLLIIFTLLISNILFALESYVVLKVGNEIITNIDIENEKKYLILLNPKLRDLKKSEFVELSKRSLIKEIIKKKELEKYIKLGEETNYVKDVIKKLYLNLNLSNIEEYRDLLNFSGIREEDVKKKIEIETRWNELIYNKFINEVEIDEVKIKKRLKKELDKNEYLKKYELSEILFDGLNKDEIDEKYKLIKQKIIENDFQTAASLYSISDTSKVGGNIGWVDDNQLSIDIRNEINKIKEKEFTLPIRIPGGFLILYINKIKKEKNNINMNDLNQKIISYEKNYQLNNFSKIYLNKVKQNIEIIKINEK
jgi:peptidyl-prolyl cis-trans isomerase SurA